MDTNYQQIVHCTSDVKAEYYQFQMKWEIHKEILHKLNKQDLAEKSGTFNFDFFNSKWAIQVRSQFDKYYHSRFLNVKVILENADQELEFKCYYCFAERNVAELSFCGLGSEVKGKVNCSSSESYGYRTSNGHNCSDIWSILRTNKYWQNNFFTIICKIEAKAVDFLKPKLSPSYISTITQSSVSSNEKNLKLLQTGLHSDITLVVKGKKFKVHKSILAIDCDYFRSMFEKNFKEGKESEIVIEEVDPEIFEKILRFIYTAKIPENLPEIADKLLLAADRFGLEHLTLECESLLMKTISIENCIELYRFADSCSRNHLRQECINFIKQNCVDLMEREDWKALRIQNLELVVQILEELLKKIMKP